MRPWDLPSPPRLHSDRCRELRGQTATTTTSCGGKWQGSRGTLLQTLSRALRPFLLLRIRNKQHHSPVLWPHARLIHTASATVKKPQSQQQGGQVFQAIRVALQKPSSGSGGAILSTLQAQLGSNDTLVITTFSSSCLSPFPETHQPQWAPIADSSGSTTRGSQAPLGGQYRC